MADEKKQGEKEKKEAQDNITETLASVKSDLDRITAANKELEDALLKQEELKARILQGGKAYAGQQQEKTPQELAQEEAAKLLKQFR